MWEKKENINFIWFLKDEKFIEWKFFPTDELNKFWEEFLLKHPEELSNMLLAEEHFSKIGLSSFKVSQDIKREALQRLKNSIYIYKRKHTIRRFVCAAVACSVALVLSLIYWQKNMNQDQNDFVKSIDHIMGNELEQQDILFVTGNRTATFQENIDIHIRNDKTAKIKTDGNSEEEISIAQHTMNKLIVPYGKRSKIVLPDGTQAWLNSGSTLEFPSTFSENTRTVYLTGEMYIEVVPDKYKSFYVQTLDFNVKVYGTKFNVSSYRGTPSSVVLVEGSVSLQPENKQEIFLTPSEQAVYSKEGTFDMQKVDVNHFISWKDGYLTFEDMPITEALKQIERHYNLSFNYGDNVSFKGLTCTGKIILSDNLDNMMTALSLISSTKYKRENKLIYIYQ